MRNLREEITDALRDVYDPCCADRGLSVVDMGLIDEIAVDGDTATGTWYLQDKVIVEAFKFVLEGAAIYSDRYARTPEGWRVAHTGYRRTYEATYSLDDLPSFKLSGPGVHTHV